MIWLCGTFSLSNASYLGLLAEFVNSITAAVCVAGCCTLSVYSSLSLITTVIGVSSVYCTVEKSLKFKFITVTMRLSLLVALLLTVLPTLADARVALDDWGPVEIAAFCNEV